MLPSFYQACFQAQLSATQYLMLQMRVLLLQKQRRVTIERLAVLFAQPIQLQSRRRSRPRFLGLPQLSIRALWFPRLKYWLKINFKQTRRIKLAMDSTQWQERNLFVVSLLWDNRAISMYGQLLPKLGNSNLAEQKALLRPGFQWLKPYRILLTAEREFHSVKLANWLGQRQVFFALPQQKSTYIQQQGQNFQRLETLGLTPGISLYISQVQVTKQRGFGTFDLAADWQRNYRDKTADEPWYILINLGTLEAAVATFKARFGIEAMFKDCKSGGYNLEDSDAWDQRLVSLVWLIAIAYSCAVMQGKRLKQMGLQKYICRIKGLKRFHRRHSSFWGGLYGQLWVAGRKLGPNLLANSCL